MNRLGLLILAILKNNSATSASTAISLYEVKDFAKLTYSITTIYRAAKTLIMEGYIAEGIKDSKSCTFYITESGIIELRGMSI